MEDGSGVIPSRADGKGPRSCRLHEHKTIKRQMTECACWSAKAVERLRGPSARFASLGMTRFAILPFSILVSLFSLHSQRET
jgi:hypothetical protein